MWIFFVKLSMVDISFFDDFDQTGNSRNFGITVEKTEQYLKKLKLRKSAGSDNLTARILRECSSALCEPLSHLFSQSISECYVPAEWKVGNVVPIPKSNA